MTGKSDTKSKRLTRWEYLMYAWIPATIACLYYVAKPIITGAL